MLTGAKPPISSQRPKRPIAQVGFLGRGKLASSPPNRGPGELCKLLQWGLGLNRAAKMFSCILQAPGGFSWNLLGPSLARGMASLPPPCCMYLPMASCYWLHPVPTSCSFKGYRGESASHRCLVLVKVVLSFSTDHLTVDSPRYPLNEQLVVFFL